MPGTTCKSSYRAWLTASHRICGVRPAADGVAVGTGAWWKLLVSDTTGEDMAGRPELATSVMPALDALMAAAQAEVDAVFAHGAALLDIWCVTLGACPCYRDGAIAFLMCPGPQALRRRAIQLACERRRHARDRLGCNSSLLPACSLVSRAAGYVKFSASSCVSCHVRLMQHGASAASLFCGSRGMEGHHGPSGSCDGGPGGPALRPLRRGC